MRLDCFFWGRRGKKEGKWATIEDIQVRIT